MFSINRTNIVYMAGLGLGLYHLLIVSGMIPLSTMPMRLTHVMLAFGILFLLKPTSQS